MLSVSKMKVRLKQIAHGRHLRVQTIYTDILQLVTFFYNNNSGMFYKYFGKKNTKFILKPTLNFKDYKKEQK